LACPLRKPSTKSVAQVAQVDAQLDPD